MHIACLCVMYVASAAEPFFATAKESSTFTHCCSSCKSVNNWFSIAGVLTAVMQAILLPSAHALVPPLKPDACDKGSPSPAAPARALVQG